MTTQMVCFSIALGAALAAPEGLLAHPEDAPTAPVVALAGAVNGRVDVTVYRGWPVFVDASLYLEEGEKTVLALKEGAWTGALKLWFVSIANSDDVAGRFTLLAATSDREEIKALEQAPAAWQLSAEETQALETGEYEVRIVFDSTESGADEAYKGAARSRMLVVRVEDAPEELPEELRVEKALLESRYEEESDNKDRALEILDGLLGEQPKALAALEARADLLVRMERWEEALTAYDATLAALREKLAAEETRPTHPPALLLKKKNGVFEKLAAAEQASAKGPGVRR